MKILITDDDFVIRRFLEKILSNYGECSIAVDGNGAINSFRRALEQGEPYDLICLDIMMPEMSGQDVLRTVREIEEERGIIRRDRTKVLMTTGLSDPENVNEALERGCEGYIVKPIDQRKLIAKLEEFFGSSIQKYASRIE